MITISGKSRHLTNYTYKNKKYSVNHSTIELFENEEIDIDELLSVSVCHSLSWVDFIEDIVIRSEDIELALYNRNIHGLDDLLNNGQAFSSIILSLADLSSPKLYRKIRDEKNKFLEGVKK